MQDQTYWAAWTQFAWKYSIAVGVAVAVTKVVDWIFYWQILVALQRP